MTQSDKSWPEDLVVWRRLEEADGTNPWSEGLRLLADEEQPAILDTSYLTADDLANPDVAANVKAIAETAALITWVVEDEDEGQAFGYWRGPQHLTLTEAPIVSLDNEGQFYLRPGGTLSEALSEEYGQWLEEGYAGLVAQCRAQGITIPEKPAQLVESTPSPTPSDYHEARYRELLARE